MEFIDEYDESRPKLVFQSRQTPSTTSINAPQNPHYKKLTLIISITFSLLFLASSFFFLESQILNPLFLWFSLSLLIGPFAPLSYTCGDIRVGEGRILEFNSEIEGIEVDESKKKGVNRRNRGKRSDFSGVSTTGGFEIVKNDENSGNLDKRSENSENGGFEFVKNGGNSGKLEVNLRGNDKGVLNSGENGGEEREWSEEDVELLRKQVAKHPVGKPRRWEVIREVFRGRHSVESVISKAKSLGKEKPVDSDSYSRFLKDRKAVNKRVEEGGENVGGGESSEEVVSWSSNEDIALLNALKVFSKDVAMRWEKIAAAVPGKSKAACMKRVSELKKEFRSSKAS